MKSNWNSHDFESRLFIRSYVVFSHSSFGILGRKMQCSVSALAKLPSFASKMVSFGHSSNSLVAFRRQQQSSMDYLNRVRPR